MNAIANILFCGFNIQLANCLLPTGQTIMVFRQVDDAEWTYVDDFYRALLKPGFLADLYLAVPHLQLTPQDQLDTI